MKRLFGGSQEHRGTLVERPERPLTPGGESRIDCLLQMIRGREMKVREHM